MNYRLWRRRNVALLRAFSDAGVKRKRADHSPKPPIGSSGVVTDGPRQSRPRGLHVHALLNPDRRDELHHNHQGIHPLQIAKMDQMLACR